MITVFRFSKKKLAQSGQAYHLFSIVNKNRCVARFREMLHLLL